MTGSGCMEARIKKFDEICLSKEEQRQIAEFDEAELLALKECKQKAKGFVWNSIKSVGFGSPIGAVKAVKNAYQFNKSDDELSKIREEKNQLRQMAQTRYEKAMELGNNQAVSQYQKGDLSYEC